ncbi:MAG: aminotransferase class I/II-fold pyridoxal phosphate-dependent enzyme [Mobilitalea sp.]
MEGLYNKLSAYSKEDFYPFHMPGHKRNKNITMSNPYEIDITEIDGFDNLYEPEEILKELSLRLRNLYGAKYSFPLVNGSTVGNLAGISAAVNRGDSVLIARNSHKSIYHALITMGLKPIYYYPQLAKDINMSCGILPPEIEDTLIKHKNIKLVVITSPTYEGVISDIKSIAEIAHRYGARLLVDEAHGAHLGFHKAFPQSAVTLGADLVIQSIHKTLPALTQSAVLHLNCLDLIDKVQQYLSIYQTSSPSYVLMAGIDQCVSILERKSQEFFDEYVDKLGGFKAAVSDLKHLHLWSPKENSSEIYRLDPSKLVISVQNTKLTGYQLQELLRTEYQLIMEMSTPDYVLGLTSICDTQEGYTRLAGALKQIDMDLIKMELNKNTYEYPDSKPVQRMIPQAAFDQQREYVRLSDCIGRISAAFITPYPPGVPLLVPGEEINKEQLGYIEWLMKEGYTVNGLSGKEKENIAVICK